MILKNKEEDLIKKLQENDRYLFLFSIGLLLLGIGYYLLFRSPILFSQWFEVEFVHHQFDLVLKVDWLPSFVHQLAFVLMTWLVLERKHKWFALLFWLVMNVTFELLQLFPNHNYIVAGTYSHEDMIAILVASIIAYILMKEDK